MSDARKSLMSGGCQCGAVRYALYAEPFGAHLCHCRMCQKAFGAFYAPLVKIKYADFAWTRGEPDSFRSSTEVDRGFCRACGTPLTFQHRGAPHLNISIGSLDHPEQVKPELQIGIESRIPWMAEMPCLPEETTESFLPVERMAGMENHQHPDCDTEDWPTKD